jgi:Uma2 family endonuclease
MAPHAIPTPALGLESWQALCKAEREGFPPLCPDLVVELASHSDQPHDLLRKVVAAQGAAADSL